MTDRPPDGTVAGLLADRAADRSGGLRTHGRTWSWSDVVAESARRAGLARELRRDSPFHVGVLLDNDPEYVFWLGGAAFCGATIVGLNPTWRGAELLHEITVTDCQLIVTDARGQTLLDDLDLPLPPERIVRIDSPEYADAVARQSDIPVVEPDLSPATLFLLLFTSGTTGAPKAGRCTNGRIVAIGHRISEPWGFTNETVSYCCMPLFHGNALMSLWIPTLVAGGCVALPPKFTASGFLDDVRRFGATFFTYVGKAIAYVLAQPEQPDDADNPLVKAFGTEAAPADRDRFLRRFGCQLVEGYGSSEGAGLVAPDPTTPPVALGRPLTPGVAIVHPDTLRTCDVAVFDEHGRVTNPDHAIGEIVGKDAVDRFEGYYNNDEANAERTRNGWYWTGDLGYVDGDGYIYFAGRRGDWIRVDGENLSALQIEQILRRHPDVVLAAVYGVPDPQSGDQVMATLELRDGSTFDPAEFVTFVTSQVDLAPKAIPRLVRVTRAMPTTGSNKIVKRTLQTERWNTPDPVFHWAGRGEPRYAALDGNALRRI